MLSINFSENAGIDGLEWVLSRLTGSGFDFLMANGTTISGVLVRMGYPEGAIMLHIATDFDRDEEVTAVIDLENVVQITYS